MRTTRPSTGRRVVVMLAITMLAATGLTGCQTVQDYVQAVDRADHQTCIDQGLQPRTQAYGDCRRAIADRRMEQNERASRSGSLNDVYRTYRKARDIDYSKCRVTGSDPEKGAIIGCQ